MGKTRDEARRVIYMCVDAGSHAWPQLARDCCASGKADDCLAPHAIYPNLAHRHSSRRAGFALGFLVTCDTRQFTHAAVLADCPRASEGALCCSPPLPRRTFLPYHHHLDGTPWTATPCHGGRESGRCVFPMT